VSLLPQRSMTKKPSTRVPWRVATAMAHTEGMEVVTTIEHGQARTKRIIPMFTYSRYLLVTTPPITINKTANIITPGV
jgi:hypothetical protein